MEILFFILGILGGVGFLVYSHKKGIQNQDLIPQEQPDKDKPIKPTKSSLNDDQDIKGFINNDNEDGDNGDMISKLNKKINNDPKFKDEFQQAVRERKDKFFKNLNPKEREQVEKYFKSQAKKVKEEYNKRKNGERITDSGNWLYETLITIALFTFLYSLIASYFGWMTPIRLAQGIFDGVTKNINNNHRIIQTEEL